MINTNPQNIKVDFSNRAYKFGISIIKTIEKLDTRNTTSRIIGDQLLRSATSIGANVIEARGASSKKDYANFFSHALKSANETKYWIHMLKDSEKINPEEAKKLIQEVTELANILAKSIMTMRGKS